ncbi:hypothetical protein AB4Z32_25355 [Massilia sp. 2TAF26]|uniref:hypothetical protein n=1 Tax=Massilia sp. 2TAF26 TaxID=3233012 RepID=UPI003F9CFB98
MRAYLCASLPVLVALLGGAGCATSTDYPRRPSAQEAAEAEGLYGLSDGYRAHLFSLEDTLYVRIGAGQEKPLLLVGPDRFASPDGDISIQFQPPQSDDSRRLVVEYYRAPGGHPPRMFSTGPLPGRGFLD